MGWYRWQGESLHLTLRVQPRARCDEIVGPHGDSLKIRITAPPVDGKANTHLLRVLADAFGVSSNSITLVSGKNGRDKGVVIDAPKQLPAEALISAN